ncbi:MAG: hypothetical protein HYX63_01460 [Gammaproteobacteria bacterium]|nr:hypothetical protein [Gammaproteobacteria bacterium]
MTALRGWAIGLLLLLFLLEGALFKHIVPFKYVEAVYTFDQITLFVLGIILPLWWVKETNPTIQKWVAAPLGIIAGIVGIWFLLFGSRSD